MLQGIRANASQKRFQRELFGMEIKRKFEAIQDFFQIISLYCSITRTPSVRSSESNDLGKVLYGFFFHGNLQIGMDPSTYAAWSETTEIIGHFIQLFKCKYREGRCSTGRRVKNCPKNSLWIKRILKDFIAGDEEMFVLLTLFEY